MILRKKFFIIVLEILSYKKNQILYFHVVILNTFDYLVAPNQLAQLLPFAFTLTFIHIQERLFSTMCCDDDDCFYSKCYCVC